MSAQSCLVRVYDCGTGQAVLLRLSGDAGSATHVLVGFGNPQWGRGRGDERAMSIANDIAQATAGQLDLIIVSHVQHEQLAGFLESRPVFDRLQVGEVWLPATEDQADAAGSKRIAERRANVRALRKMANQLRRANAPLAEPLRQYIRLFGPAAGGDGPDEAVDYLMHHPSKPRLRYLQTDEPPIALPSEVGLAYVLAPRPASAGLRALAASAVDAEIAPIQDAFDERFRIPCRRTRSKTRSFQWRYYCEEDGWRAIDNEWLNGAASLALGVDRETADASLAIAIEVDAGGPVLLFPGNVPAANWRDWAALSWKMSSRGPSASPARVSATDLLRRTRLLHVGRRLLTQPALGAVHMLGTDFTAIVSANTVALRQVFPELSLDPLMRHLEARTRRRVLVHRENQASSDLYLEIVIRCNSEMS